MHLFFFVISSSNALLPTIKSLLLNYLPTSVGTKSDRPFCQAAPASLEQPRASKVRTLLFKKMQVPMHKSCMQASTAAAGIPRAEISRRRKR
ncbi:hypothetical protein F5Y10DRAFT_228523 [Nemania abortiva]|nr:hypothetical protein F5Y10DRAFT_228523 [Nemania abortiva]